MGAKSKLTPEVQRHICEAIRHGVPYARAAASGGVTYETFRVWRDTHPAFSAAVEKAEGECVTELLDLIRSEARERNWTAAAWILERRYPDDFGRRERQQIEHSGDLGININITRRSKPTTTEGE